MKTELNMYIAIDDETGVINVFDTLKEMCKFAKTEEENGGSITVEIDMGLQILPG